MGILMILIVLLQIINHNIDHIRVFTIGIGETVNRHLIRNLAKIGSKKKNFSIYYFLNKKIPIYRNRNF